MNARLAGKVAIVTGAAKGMGLATAMEKAHDGASVVMTDIDAAGLESSVGEVRSLGKAMTVACDIQSRRDVDELIQRTRRE